MAFYSFGEVICMEEFERVQIESRAELRAWLEANHTRTEGVWLVVFKKHVPDKYVPWQEVVEEALCYGWIDSRTRKVDDDRTKYLLSPRRRGSPWSRRNKQLVKKLLSEHRMQPPGLALVEQAKQDGSWTIYDEIEELVIPGDLAAALAENEDAARYFAAFGASSKKNILWWIKTAKRSETRCKRICETVELAQHNVRAKHPEAQAFKRR
jgi:uncharacterized protein YdeI (YjbR/CyaY-like superfamily)